jgi:acetyl-CoA acetyltransferase
MGVVARQLWAQSGLTPADISVGVLYDHFTPYVLMQLEELGFCGPGEAPSFVADGRSASPAASRSTRTADSSGRPTSTG